MSNSKKRELEQCTIILTHGCNLRCDFCFEKETGYSSNEQLELSNLKQLIDLCGEAGVRYVFLTGGEPLTYPYLIDILQYIAGSHSSIIPTIATNGILLADLKLCQQLSDNGLSYIDVSMKGGSGEEWKKITGCNGLASQLKAIRNLASTSIEFTCSMVVTQDNATKVCDTVQMAHENGARQFSFTFFIDNNGFEQKDHLYLNEHNPFTLISAFVSQIDRLCAITDEWWIEYSFPMCVYTEEQLQLLEGRMAAPCFVHLENAITFNPQMELLPCDMYLNSSLGRFGKDFSTYPELRALLDSPRTQHIIGELRKQPSPQCQACEHLAYCRGGCPVLWKNYSFEALMNFKNKYFETR